MKTNLKGQKDMRVEGALSYKSLFCSRVRDQCEASMLSIDRQVLPEENRLGVIEYWSQSCAQYNSHKLHKGLLWKEVRALRKITFEFWKSLDTKPNTPLLSAVYVPSIGLQLCAHLVTTWHASAHKGGAAVRLARFQKDSVHCSRSCESLCW